MPGASPGKGPALARGLNPAPTVDTFPRGLPQGPASPVRPPVRPGPDTAEETQRDRVRPSQKGRLRGPSLWAKEASAGCLPLKVALMTFRT